MKLYRFAFVLLLLCCIAIPALSTFNVWTPLGIVVAQVASDAPEQPTVFYENTCHVVSPNLDGKCFKMWFTTGAATAPVGINYAESNNGTTWTRYVSNPVVASQWGGRVFKNGSTYYLYSSAQVFATGINVRTSSDGLTWALAQANAITTSVSGFDSVAVGQLNVLTIQGGTWYGYYWGTQTAPGPTENFYQGLVTSTDGVHWTKDPGNPVSSLNSGTFLGGTTWNGASALGFATVNGSYYAWGQIAAQGYQGATANQPSDIMRWKATNPAGPWTPVNVEVYSRTQASETPNTQAGQVADPCIIEVNGTTYLYFTASVNGNAGNNYTVNAATSSLSLSNLVLTFEGVVNVPLSGSPNLNLTTTASDNFDRANGSLGANWTKLNNAGIVNAQIVSNQVTSTVAGTAGDSWYNAISFSNEQWSQVTVKTCAANSFVGVMLRANSNGNSYRLYWNGTAGASGTVTFGKLVSGTFSTITTISSVTVNVNDVLMGAAVGSTLMFYRNGILVGLTTDTSVPSGNAGFVVAPITSTSNAFIDNWSAGGFQSSPEPVFNSTLVGPRVTVGPVMMH